MGFIKIPSKDRNSPSEPNSASRLKMSPQALG